MVEFGQSQTLYMPSLGITLVVLSAAVLVYVVILYPVLLWYLARHKSPVEKRGDPVTVSIIIPVRNGARYLRAKLESVLALNYPKALLEIVVVSDGSTDATEEIAAEFASFGVKLLNLP